MKLVIGLGNPGSAYVNTRHNAGYRVIDLLQKSNLPKDVIIKKSDDFMNQSGDFVRSQVDKYQITNKDLYIIHDDLDIPLGSFKIQYGRGPKDHNGINSINSSLGSDKYWHIRIGIDNRPLDSRPMGEEYVLENFSDEEEKKLTLIYKNICKKLETHLKTIK